MHFLIHGFILSSFSFGFLLYVRCGEEDISYGYTVNWVYENNTGNNITLEVYNQLGEKFSQWEIQDQANIIIPETEHEHYIFPFFLDSKITRIAVSVIARFENGKCLEYSKRKEDSSKNIFDLMNYNEYEQVAIKNLNPGEPYFEKSPITLTWTFTPEDIAQAIDCDVL